MVTKHYSENMLQVSESANKNVVAVSVQETAAGSADITFFYYQPFLRGEDYPALAQVWDNKEDGIYDTL